jgi:hypothetical protein
LSEKPITADGGPLSLKRQCWGSSEGQCAGVLSKEHVISDKILKLVGGMSIEPGRDKPDILFTSGKSKGQRVIGDNNLVLKYLCQHHNSELSAYDSEAAEFLRYLNVLLGRRPSPDGEKDLIGEFNGLNVERWFAKTLMNVFAFGYQLQKERLPHHPVFIDSTSVSKKLWGGGKFPKPFGLYMQRSMRGTSPIRVGHQDLKLQLKSVVIELLEPTGHKSLRYVPMALALNYLGVEFLGVFNITGYSDEAMMVNFAEPIEKLISGTIYHPKAIDFNIQSDQKPEQAFGRLTINWE